MSVNYNSLTDEQKRQLKSYAEILGENIYFVDEFNRKINGQTGAFQGSKDELSNLIDRTKDYYFTLAAQDYLVQAGTKMFELRQQYSQLASEMETKYCC